MVVSLFDVVSKFNAVIIFNRNLVSVTGSRWDAGVTLERGFRGVKVGELMWSGVTNPHLPIEGTFKKSTMQS